MTSASKFFKNLGRSIEKQVAPVADTIDHLFQLQPAPTAPDLGAYNFPKAVQGVASPFLPPYDIGLIQSPYQVPVIGVVYFGIEFSIALYSS